MTNCKLKRIDYLEGGYSLDVFLKNFPGVKREQAIGVLEIAGKILTSGKQNFEYESIA